MAVQVTNNGERPTAILERQMLRAEVEDFLYLESELLDNWKLKEWSDLLTDDGVYYVHTAEIGYDASPDTTLFLIADDKQRARERGLRLFKRAAASEYPHSRVRHFITNVRVNEAEIPDEFDVLANVAVHRWRNRNYFFAGTVRYRLRREAESFRIAIKRFVIEAEDVREQSHVSIIL